MSARDAATSDDEGCVAGSVRKPVPLYDLSYYSPADAQRAATDRLDHLEAIARASGAESRGDGVTILRA